MKRAIGWLGVLVLSAGFSLSSGPEVRRLPAEPISIQEKLEAIEQDLFAFINTEREKEGIPPVRFSASLSALARRHSAGMAQSDRLSHDSVSGEDYETRLVGAGFFFFRSGENVARSETTAVEFIHRSLMTSRDHRQNILDPGFDTVGIGVVENRGASAFFVTQDFIRAVEPLSSESAETELAERIQGWRKDRSLSRLIFREEIGRLARILAAARAGDKPLPQIPSSLGEAHVYFVITPSLEDIDFQTLHLDNPFYNEGGAGVSFGRLKDYPGGAFCVVLILLPKYEYPPVSRGPVP